MKDDYNKWMSEALVCALYAQSIGEVPVGAVCVLDNKLISKGWNQVITSCDPTAHAEVVALRKAAEAVENYRLLDVDLYVTLEPCLMCAGAMIHSRINQLIYAANDPKTGVIESKIQLLEYSFLNHRPKVISGIKEKEASDLLTQFFKAKRQTNTK